MTGGAELGVIGGADVGQLVLLPVRPDVFDRIQFRRVGRQLGDLDSAALAAQVIANQTAAVNSEPIPDHEQLAGQAAAQLFQEIDQFGAPDGAGVELEIKSPKGQPGHRRKLLPVEVVLQDRRLTARRPGAAAMRPLAQSAFVEKDDGTPLPPRFFFSAGQVVRFHALIRASSRSLARPTGRCGLQPNRRSTRQTWPG